MRIEVGQKYLMLGVEGVLEVSLVMANIVILTRLIKGGTWTYSPSDVSWLIKGGGLVLLSESEASAWTAYHHQM